MNPRSPVSKGKKKGVSALAARMGLDPSKMMRGVGGPTSRPKQPEPTVKRNTLHLLKSLFTKKII